MNFFPHFKTCAVMVAVGFGLISLSASAAPVSPATPPAPDDIVDIRPPIHIAAPFPWLASSAGALGLAGTGAAAWMLLRRKRRKLAYEIALERLENTRPLMRENNAEPFCLAVSEIVRLFIEEVLPVRAVHQTTNEFLRDLAKLFYPELAPHRETLADFLRHCDLAKFARWSLTLAQMETMLESARAVVVDVGQPKSAKPQSAAGATPVTASYSSSIS
jgi:hypothetical protein